MTNFMNMYFGPLSKKYCVYFYYVSIFFFLMYVITLIGAIAFIIKNYKDFAKINLSYVINLVMVLINMLLSYFVNRLLHTMCVNSIQ
jgi:asparagine N-glycosylation enzyme membrane subunit Stt3